MLSLIEHIDPAQQFSGYPMVPRTRMWHVWPDCPTVVTMATDADEISYDIQASTIVD